MKLKVISILSAFLVLLFAVSCSDSTDSSDTGKPMPLAVNNIWEYDVTIAGSSDQNATLRVQRYDDYQVKDLSGNVNSLKLYYLSLTPVTLNNNDQKGTSLYFAYNNGVYTAYEEETPASQVFVPIFTFYDDKEQNIDAGYEYQDKMLYIKTDDNEFWFKHGVGIQKMKLILRFGSKSEMVTYDLKYYQIK